MIRLSDISLPPEHSAHQLPFEAARMLRDPQFQNPRRADRPAECGRPEEAQCAHHLHHRRDGGWRRKEDSEAKRLQAGIHRPGDAVQAAQIRLFAGETPGGGGLRPRWNVCRADSGAGGLEAAGAGTGRGCRVPPREGGKILPNGRAGHEKQRPVRRGRRGDVFRRQAEHRGQQPQNWLDSGTVRGGGGKGGYSL